MASSFARLVHADWSTHSKKRWIAEAHRTARGWLVDAPQLVGSIENFRSNLLQKSEPTLAGFDFPIGFPSAFGRKTAFGGFCEALDALGLGRWSRFFHVAERAEDISIYRPFYPRVANASAKQKHLIDALGVKDINELKRQCERMTKACPLFWTLGPNQVGKAAIAGWLDVVRPARREGALLWPFEGKLPELAEADRLVICETYPAQAYGHVGVQFRNGMSKKKQSDRRTATAHLPSRCEENNIQLTNTMAHVIADGFGPKEDGEDPFDATIGLLSMIEVVDGRRAAGPSEGHWPDRHFVPGALRD